MLIYNRIEHKKILDRIMTVLCAFFIHKAVITVIVLISKGYLLDGDLFTMKNFKEILFFNFSKWDSNWYLNIARNGYYSAKSTAFFPLYPLLIRLLNKITSLSYIVCGIAISSICFLIALYVLQKLVEIDFDSIAAKKVVYIFALNPVAFYFTSVYTESTFLMLSIICLLNMRNKRWFSASIAGSLCCATRNIGVILAIPFAIEYFYAAMPVQAFQKGYSIKQRLLSIKNEFKVLDANKLLSGLWIFVIPSGLFAYMVFLYIKFGNAFTFIHAQGDYGRSTLNPIKSIVAGLWVTLKMSINKYGFRLQFYYFFEFIAVLCFVVLLILCFRKMRFSYWILMVISLLVPLTKPALTSTVTDYFVSFSRYLIVSFPFMLGLYIVSKKSNIVYILIISLSTIILQMNVYYWSLKFWVA